MATARVPRPEEAADVNPQTITVNSNVVPSTPACIIANGQQVTFVNSSGFSNLYFHFQPDADAVNGYSLFSDFSIASYNPPNNQVTQTPQVNNRTVNYAITVGNQTPTDYPYAIQVGAGPLYVHVWYANNEVNCYPSPAVIPVGGTLELYKNSNDTNSYPVTWPTPTNPFTPALTGADGLPHTENTGVNSYSYTAAKVGIGGGTGKGGGTVKIKGA